MEKMIEAIRARAQQFTHSEIQAEVLRQRIQELEQKGLTDSNDPQTLSDLQELRSLRHRLQFFREHAEQDSQNRSLMGEFTKMLEKVQESGDIPQNSESVLKELRKRMDEVEFQRRIRYVRELERPKIFWSSASWAGRAGIIHRLASSSIKRIAIEKPRHHLGRLALGGALKMARKRH